MNKIEPPENGILEEVASSLMDINLAFMPASLGISSPQESIVSAIAEFIKLPINIARNRKLDKFLKEVSDRLNYLSQVMGKHELLLGEILNSNEEFTEIFVNAALVAMNQKRKIEILSTATANSAIKIDIEHDEKIQFISYIQDLTLTQILLLKSLLENEYKIYEKVHI